MTEHGLLLEWKIQLCTKLNYPKLGYVIHEILSKPPLRCFGISQHDVKLHVGKQACELDQGICGKAW